LCTFSLAGDVDRAGRRSRAREPPNLISSNWPCIAATSLSAAFPVAVGLFCNFEGGDYRTDEGTATPTCRDNAEQGFVTLSIREREKRPSRVISSARNGGTPRAHRRGPKGSVGMGGCQMALDVENVVDDGMR
jgi:hypothetical protein